ncbi:MAG: hypothetical protein H6536_08555 [Bacteroidales bacterium]|nr:hypothetical protein [Bacteroidales bacterium]
MKNISLTQTEVNELIDLYQTEIDRAQRRIVSLKAILSKISDGKILSDEAGRELKKAAKTLTVEPKVRGRKPSVAAKQAPIEKAEPKKRGPKPKVKVEDSAVKEAKPKKKSAKVKVEKVAKKAVVVVKEPKKRGRKPKTIRKSIKKGKGEEKVKWIDLIYNILRTKNSLMLSNSLTVAAMEYLGIDEADRDRVKMAISTNLTRLTKYDKTINKYSKSGTPGSFYGMAEWFNDKGELKAEYQDRLM